MKLEKLTYPLYFMMHPFAGSDGLKWEKKGSFRSSLAVLVLLFAVNVFSKQSTGFLFNYNRKEDINTLLILAGTFFVFLLWVVANWSLTTFMGGEGKFIDIWIGSSYALMPYITISFIIAVVSNFVSLDAEPFLRYGSIGALVWSFIIVVIFLSTIHQYSLKQTITNIVLTFVGMAVVIFLLILIFSLFQQLYIFLYTLFNEIMFRIE